MYSRNMRNGGRYFPPPGYTGNAFNDGIGVKLHEGMYEENDSVAVRNEAEQGAGKTDAPPCRASDVSDSRRAFSELISGLRGRLRAEEMIILLVMLLTASDGIRAETLILAVALLYRA